MSASFVSKRTKILQDADRQLLQSVVMIARVALDRLGVTCPCHEWHFVLIRQIHEFSAPRFLIKLDVSGCELH